ncbi:MAG: hypothetical protein HYV32_02015 [Candidatus Kerfeldbacteria bacterium]|nr:hypothetical protein [Candidatus Kerfeldbacteria bacterium]
MSTEIEKHKNPYDILMNIIQDAAAATQQDESRKFPELFLQKLEEAYGQDRDEIEKLFVDAFTAGKEQGVELFVLKHLWVLPMDEISKSRLLTACLLKEKEGRIRQYISAIFDINERDERSHIEKVKEAGKVFGRVDRMRTKMKKERGIRIIPVKK